MIEAGGYDSGGFSEAFDIGSGQSFEIDVEICRVVASSTDLVRTVNLEVDVGV